MPTSHDQPCQEAVACIHAALARGPIDEHDPAVLAAADLLAAAADDRDEQRRDCGLRALFGGVIEALNDRLDSAARRLSDRVMLRVLWRCCRADLRLAGVLDEISVRNEAQLWERRQQLDHPAPLPDGSRRVAVLSRVTVGADIALTSIALRHLHAACPGAQVVLVGDQRLAGLFAGWDWLELRPLAYPRRGPLGERLLGWLALRRILSDCDLVLGPDSRLDQLGLLPCCPVSQYRLWASTQPDQAAPQPLSQLLDAWCARQFGSPAGLLPALALDQQATARRHSLAAAFGPAPICAVKLDHGGTPNKALPRAAELAILRRLRERGWRILLDRGFGETELAASDALLAELGWQAVELDDSGQDLGQEPLQLQAGALATVPVLRFHGSIAGWAAALANCQLALAYDSVGHHLAAALGVPLISIFTGHPSPAFVTAWSPQGPGPRQLLTLTKEQREDPAAWQTILESLPAAEP